MDASEFAEILALVAQSIEVAKTIVYYKRQAATFASRLLIFQAAFNHSFQKTQRLEVPVEELTKIACAQDSIRKSLQDFIEACESTFSVDLWDWSDWDQYFQKNALFGEVLQIMMALGVLLGLSLPLGRMQDTWQDEVDLHVDYRAALRVATASCGATHAVTRFLLSHAPARPALRLASASDILTLFEIDTSYADSSDDEDEEADDEYASDNEDDAEREQRRVREEEARRLKAMKYRGNFTSSAVVSTFKESPVMLKKVGASYCRGGSGTEGVGHALLALAVTALHLQLPPSPLLLLPLAACTAGVGVTEEDGSNDLESLLGRRQKEREAAAGALTPSSSLFSALGSLGRDDTIWKDQPVPRTLGLLTPLAPFGCLLNFLTAPPPGLVPRGRGGAASASVPSHIKLSVMLDVCQGLQHLHAHGVVHGRLHSRNVLICTGFRAKLVDFGTSHLISPACAMGEGLSGAKRGEGFNPRWRAPEDLLRAEYSLAFPSDDGEAGEGAGEGAAVLDGVAGGLASLGGLLDTSARARLELEQHSFALVTPKSDTYALAMLMYSIVADGNRPFFNLPWDEAVVTAVRGGGRPSFPSLIADRGDFEGIIPVSIAGGEEGGGSESAAGPAPGDSSSPSLCLIEACWRADPAARPPLDRVREKLEENLGSALKQYGGVVIGDIGGQIEALDSKMAVLREEADKADAKISSGRAWAEQKEAEMGKLFKPVEKKVIAQQLEKAYPRLQEATAKNDALRAELAGLAAQKEALRGRRDGSEQDLSARQKLLEKRELSNVVFSKEVFVKQFSDLAKPVLLHHLRAACSDEDTLSRAVAKEFQSAGVEAVDGEMWDVVCRGDVFGAGSTYHPKISSLYGYDGTSEGAGVAGAVGDKAGSAAGAAAAAKKVLQVDVTKYYDNKDFEGGGEAGRSAEEPLPPGPLAKCRTRPRREVYEDPTPDLRVSQFATEGFSPLHREQEQEQDKRRKKVRGVAAFLDGLDLVARDDTERMFVQYLEPQLQLLLAARGDVRDANGMHLKKFGFNADLCTEKVVAQGAGALHLAASRGHLYALKFLVDVHGLPADQADACGWAPFSHACYHGQLPAARFLCERHRANMERVDAEGLMPLHLAAMRGHLSLVKYLLFRLRHKGGEGYFTDKDLGGGLLHWACMATTHSAQERTFDRVVRRHVELLLHLLVEEGADVNIRARADQSTPLMWACGSTPPSLTKLCLVDTLVENGADLAAVDQAGRSCLFYAASAGDLQLVQTLVEQFNVDPANTNHAGKTPAEVAPRGPCAAYLLHCLRDPPRQNRDFVPARFLKKLPFVQRRAAPRDIGTYLMKKSPSLLKGWQKRYFVMKGGYLRYYGTKEEFEAGKEPKGAINLLLLPEDDPNKSASLAGPLLNEIHLLSKAEVPAGSDRTSSVGKKAGGGGGKDRVFVLQAPDHATALAWVAVVKEWIEYLHQ